MPARRKDDLTRARATREPKTRFTIFCEGKNTEPAYLDALKQLYDGALIELCIYPAAGVPYTQAQHAITHAKARGLVGKRRKSLDSYETDDQIWVMFDRDEHSRYDEAIGLCAAKGIRVARSNPCFELWLILHERDHDRPDGRREIQRFLGSLRPEYDRSGGKQVNCAELIGKLEAAEKRAEAQLRRREAEGSPFGPPSTTVNELTQEIRAASLRSSRAPQ